MNRYTFLNQAQAAEAISLAASVLESQLPKLSVVTFVGVGEGRTEVRARFDWPGVLSLWVKGDGKLIAKSLAGQPHTVDLSSVEVGSHDQQ